MAGECLAYLAAVMKIQDRDRSRRRKDIRNGNKNMLAISLMRMGAKGKPFYRVVVKEKRSKRDGAYIENLGTYNPMLNPAEVNLKHDRIQYWVGVGAQPTETVKSLIKNNPAGE